MSLEPTQRTISTLYVHNGLLYIGMADYRVIVIDLDENKIITQLRDNLWEVKSVHVNDKYILIGTLNQKLALYDHDYSLIAELNHDLGVTVVHSDNTSIYTGGYDGVVRVWDVENLSFKGQLDDHSIRVNTITSDSSFIYTGDGFTVNNAKIRIWSNNDFNLITTMDTDNNKRVTVLKLFKNKLYSGHGSPGMLQIWDLDNEQVIGKIETQYDVQSIDRNDELLVFAVKDRIKILDASTLETIHIQTETGREVSDCKIHEDKIIYSSRNRIQILDLSNFELIASIDL